MKAVRPALFALFLSVCLNAAAEARISEYEAAILSGSAQLELVSLSAYRDSVAARMRAGVLTRLGFGPDPGSPRVLRAEIGVTPILRYDGNINNGVIGDRLDLGGLVFLVDEESRARAGLVGGLALSAGSVLSFGQGGTLTLGAGLRYERALRHPLSIRGGFLQACGSQHIGRLTWIGLCQSFHREKRSLDGSRAAVTTLSFSRVLRNRFGPAELGIELGSLRNDGAQRGFAGLVLRQAAGGFGAFSLEIAGEHRRTGVNTADLRIRPGYSTFVRGRPLAVSLLYQKEGGGQFLGRSRRDEFTLLRFDYAVSRSLSLSLGYRKRHSSAGIYSGSSMIFGFNMRPLALRR